MLRSVVFLETSVTRAGPLAASYSPVPPRTAAGRLFSFPFGTKACRVSVPFESWNWTLQRVLPPLKVQTPRLKPVSSPETLSPNPKRSPLWGLPLGKNSAFFTEVPTRCSDFGAGAAVPTVACIAIAPSAASTATSASIGLRDSSLLLTRESSLCISHLLLPARDAGSRQRN